MLHHRHRHLRTITIRTITTTMEIIIRWIIVAADHLNVRKKIEERDCLFITWNELSGPASVSFTIKMRGVPFEAGEKDIYDVREYFEQTVDQQLPCFSSSVLLFLFDLNKKILHVENHRYGLRNSAHVKKQRKGWRKFSETWNWSPNKRRCLSLFSDFISNTWEHDILNYSPCMMSSIDQKWSALNEENQTALAICDHLYRQIQCLFFRTIFFRFFLYYLRSKFLMEENM